MVGVTSLKLARRSQWVLSIVLPASLIVVLLLADLVEGPKTAYVGVLTAIPFLSAVFGTPKSTALVSALTWLSAFAFGLFASDGNERAQTVRLVIIALFSVIAVIAASVRTRREKQLSEAMAKAAQAELMRSQANTDALTGLHNRRGVIERINDRECSESTLAIIDIDHFKDINDRYGHIVGDEVIQAVGARLVGGLSGEDIVGRWGGDEFVVLLNLEIGLGAHVIERVFSEVRSEPFATSVGQIPLEISVGLSSWHDGEILDTVLARADKALYSAKNSGRNRFVVATTV